MTHHRPLLLLAGSAEARHIAGAARARGLALRAVLTEAPRGGARLPVPARLLTTGDAEALAAEVAGARAVLDAAHAFDGWLSATAHAAARDRGLPYLALRRPPWSTSGRKGWQRVRDIPAALPHLRPGARVFCTTGAGSLPELLSAAPGTKLFLRRTAGRAPVAGVVPVFGAPPFPVAGETALFRALGIDTLLARNLGGTPARGKLDAAAALGLRVLLVDRPPLPAGAPCVGDPARALDWMEAL